MSNDIIREAFIQEAQKRCIEYYSQAAKHRFSLGYIINRRKIINDYEKSLEKDSKSLRLKPVLRLNLIIVVVLLAVLASAAFAIYTIINGFSFRTHPTHSVVEYLEIDTGKTSIEEEYYLLETDEIIIENEYSSPTWRIIQYNYKNHTIVFHQNTVNSSLNINTENRNIEPVYVGDYNGFYIEQDEELILCWFQNGYIFTITGNIDKNESLNLATLTKTR